MDSAVRQEPAEIPVDRRTVVLIVLPSGVQNVLMEQIAGVFHQGYEYRVSKKRVNFLAGGMLPAIRTPLFHIKFFYIIAELVRLVSQDKLIDLMSRG